MKTSQPLILCDPENGWNEIITESMIRCKNDLARRWEVVLRKEIFWGESIQDDKLIEPVFYIGHTYNEGDWGVKIDYIGGKDGGAYTWNTPIADIDDLDKLHYPELLIDHRFSFRLLTSPSLFPKIR